MLMLVIFQSKLYYWKKRIQRLIKALGNLYDLKLYSPGFDTVANEDVKRCWKATRWAHSPSSSGNPHSLYGFREDLITHSCVIWFLLFLVFCSLADSAEQHKSKIMQTLIIRCAMKIFVQITEEGHQRGLGDAAENRNYLGQRITDEVYLNYH